MSNILKSSIEYKNPHTENVIELIRDGLRSHADEVIVIDRDTGSKWTGRQLEVAVTRVASYLRQECGLRKGDLCSMYCYEGDRCSILMLAVMSAGGVVSLLSSDYSGRQAHDTSRYRRAKLFIGDKNLLETRADDILPLADQVQFICYNGQPERFAVECRSISHLFDNDNESGTKPKGFNELISDVNIEADNDFAVVQYSSGTTGNPKTIPRTHKNLCHLVASVNHEELMNLRPGITMMGSLVLTHRPGLWALLASVHCGSTFVIGPSGADINTILSAIAKYKVNIFSSSLPMLSVFGYRGALIKDEFDLSSLNQMITSGAKIVHENLPMKIVEEFNLKHLRQCFGMTESGWNFILEDSIAKRKVPKHYLTPGHVVPGIEAAVMAKDKDDVLLGPNARGELALRGPQVFPGYCTDEPGKLNRGDFTKSGWFKTGDEVFYDDEGMFHIVGRYKEFIILENNARYYPTEIETLISEHPAVEGVCVVKMVQEDKNVSFDIARACVVLKPRQTATQTDILEFVTKRIPDVLLSGGIKILDKFPRLANGKVDKQSLKQEN